MAGLNIEVCQERRRATVQLPMYWRTQYALDGTQALCMVHGVFQYDEGDGTAEPMFVCELPDGRCFPAQIDNVRFLCE